MIAAEQWYEFQEQYQKYGLDMKPRESRQHREERRRAARAKTISADLGVLKDRKLILMGVFAIAVALIMVIVMTAYAASIRYDISIAQAENNVLWDDIKQLQSSQTSMNGVGFVEQRAGDELDMKSAPANRIVYVTGTDVPPEGFADVLESKAFQ